MLMYKMNMPLTVEQLDNVLYRDRGPNECPAFQLADFDRMQPIGEIPGTITFRQYWYDWNDHKATKDIVHPGWDLHAAARVFAGFLTPGDSYPLPPAFVRHLVQRAKNAADLDARVAWADAWLSGALTKPGTQGIDTCEQETGE